MQGSARIYDVRMAQFVLKIEKLSHTMLPRASQDLRSPSLIMAPVRGYYLFRGANSFPKAQLEESCELRGTNNVQGKISVYTFAPNGGYRVYYPSDLSRNARSF